MRKSVSAAALGLAVLLLPPPVGAKDRAVPASALPECEGVVTRKNVVACALAMSPTIREAVAEQKSSDGRVEAARPFLPSNPTVSGNISSRSTVTERALNWSVGLAQEIEVAGQRGLRMDAAEGEARAQALRVAATKASVAEETWATYFRALAGRERQALAARLEAATEAVASTVRGMAIAGLASEVDADVAEGAAIRAAQERLEADGIVVVAQAQLGLLLGRVGPVAPTGELEPVAGVQTQVGAAHERLELQAAQQEEVALRRRVDLLKRSRAPNPSISVFAQNDGFDERVLGVGLSIPIPFPQPIGRTLSGEIAEATGSAEKAQAIGQRLRRDLRVESLSATTEYEVSLKVRRLYTKERIQRASVRLESIAAQVKAARLPVREALVAQQALVEQLKADIDARESLCVASVRLARASGQSLEGNSL